MVSPSIYHSGTCRPEFLEAKILIAGFVSKDLNSKTPSKTHIKIIPFTPIISCLRNNSWYYLWSITVCDAPGQELV